MKAMSSRWDVWKWKKMCQNIMNLHLVGKSNKTKTETCIKRRDKIKWDALICIMNTDWSVYFYWNSGQILLCGMRGTEPLENFELL